MRNDVLRRAVLSMVAGAMVLTACSDDASSSEESVPATAVGGDSVSTASEATTTSTSTSTSTSPRMTATEPLPVIETIPNEDGSVPETTEVPADPEIPLNTMYDPSTPEGEVEQVVLADNEAYKVCLSTLPRCDVAASTRYGALEYREGTAEFLAGFNERGVVAEDVDRVSVVVEEVRVGDLSVEAEVVLCFLDDSRLFVPGLDGAPAEIVEEGFYSSRRELLVTKIGDQWFITGSANLEVANGIEDNLCA